MKISYQNFQKTGTAVQIFRKVIKAMGTEAFWFIIFFIIMEFALGEYLFYKYIYLIEKNQPAISGQPVRFQEKTYQAVLDELRLREAILNSSSSSGNFADPFSASGNSGN